MCWLIALLVRLRTERAQAQEQLVYDATHDALTGLPNRVALSTRMASDLTGKRIALTFKVFFQPIVALADRRAVGMEALIRWQQPQQGWLPPADFIPVAEETGLIIPIGAWVLEHTARQIQEWKLEGRWRPGFYVSVNLSGHQLLDGELLAQIDSFIARCGLLAGELRLELTETAVITNIDAASSVLPALRERHIPLYMDDFGTGYSSLGYSVTCARVQMLP